MKIAFVTDDGKIISKHFGRAPFYLVFTLQNGNVVSKEMRNKISHREFRAIEGSGHSLKGHEFCLQADMKHRAILEAIKDCHVVVARGMGHGAQRFLTNLGIEIILTDIEEIDRALGSYLSGCLIKRSDLMG